MKLTRAILSVSLLGFLATGCVSQPLKIDARPKSTYEELGEGRGTATGIMLFNLIPIGQNERFVRAYEAAVQSKGGATATTPPSAGR